MPLTRLNAYLAELPGGLVAHPSCQRKAVQYRQLLTDTPKLVELAAELPSVLAQLLQHPLPVSAFLPTVHENALYLAARDLFFPTDEAFVEAMHRISRQLMQGPLYRIMMTLLSPSMIVRGAASRFGAFNRGTTLETEAVSAHHARAVLTSPAHLYTPLLAEGWAATFQAAVEASGGRDTHFAVVEHTVTRTVFEGRWR